MVFCLFFHSSIIVLLLILYNRWLDEEVLGDLCLYSLIVELCLAFFNINYIYYTESIFFLHCGFIFVDSSFFHISCIFFFDEVSGFFFSILDFALILCFYFLIEYFEYDTNGVGIILLSSLFSHFAIWYFCVFDLFLLILFWESISLISFLLIQHWSYRLPTYKAGIKVFCISQLGDIPIFIFIFLFINRFSTTDLSEILSQLFFIAFEYIYFTSFNIIINFATINAFCVSFAILLKAAQFFFYPWLLDAMEAPVPISAQLHSSTLVIIGFYFYLRFQNLFLLAPCVSYFLIFCGVVTIIGASLLGFFQDDGKKLLACSTASQLGYAIVGLGLYFFEEALFLMIFCCCNKAYTFIWFGTLMDKYAGISDFRFISGIVGFSFLESAGLIIAVLNFTILPGAFSWHIKSLFLKGQYLYESIFIKLALDILSLTWFFSSLYLFFLIFILFFKPNRGIWRLYTLQGFGVFIKIKFAFNRFFLLLYSKYSIIGSITNIFWYYKNFNKYYCYITINSFFYNMSFSFFLLLSFSCLILLSYSNLFFYTYFDISWIYDNFYWYNFILIDYYS